ncbi:hypothetical protein C8R43DRAFT_1140639 [Mycena crocata]|nr:hypothetical protein C8R43DRAFT_1140928 [Mycena crocata]KAJ7106143.1 hypothetical protein C8R43DRAFT_1140639 [Mycena crocata]
MTHSHQVSSGTESHSAPVVAPSPPAGGDPAAVAAFFINAINSFTQGHPIPATECQRAAAAEHQDAAAAPIVAAPAPIGFLTTGPWVAGGLYVVVPTGPLLPIAEPEYAVDEGPIWYCITKGKYVGLTLSNALALSAVVGVSGGTMKGYKAQTEALATFNEMRQYGFVVVVA